MKVLILNAQSPKNLGDYAITQALLSELQRVWPKVDIILMGLDTRNLRQAFPKLAVPVSLHDWAVYYNGSQASQRIWRIPVMMLCSILWRVSGGRWPWYPTGLSATFAAYQDVDLIICSGGGGLRLKNTSFAEVANLVMVLWGIWFAHWSGKPVYWYSQSFGTISPFLRWLVKATLVQARLFGVRESTSEQFLLKLGVPPAKLLKTTDSVFTFLPKTWPTTPKRTHPQIVITAREWLSPAAQDHYEHQLAELASWLVKQYQAQIVLVPHVQAPDFKEDDLQAVTRIYEQVSSKTKASVKIVKPASPNEVLQLLRKTELMIGTRMHSLILALISGTPCLAIEYEHKTGAILKQLGLGKFVHRIESDFLAKLKMQSAELLKEANLLGRKNSVLSWNNLA